RASPPQYRLSDGRFVLSEPGEPMFPAELVRTAPEATVGLEAARARPRTELAWLTRGASWEAVYQVILTGVRCQVSGAATITSQSLAADSAEVQLVAGSIGRARGPAPVVFETARAERMVIGSPPVLAGAAEEAVGETHVYQLSGRLSIEPGAPVTTALFPRAAVLYTQELSVPGALPWRGFLGQSAAEPNRVPVQVWYTLKRPRGTPFGDRPLAGGTLQLYQADSAGRVQLVGEARSDHTAPGRDLRVQSGEAFDVTAERLHLADLHFGGLADVRKIEALEKMIPDLRPDVTVIAGDLSQRARHGELQRARAFANLAAETAPVHVIPGNHDVQWWTRPLIPFGKD